MIDVAIGILLLFLISSLTASAVVEAIGGFFHRRSKHMWDALDLLLGNTSPNASGEVGPIVDELYRQPFITGLVRPTERAKLQGSVDKRKLRDPGPRVGRFEAKDVSKAVRARRFYGPKHIDAKEFAKALLAVVRPGGAIDDALVAVSKLEEKAAPGSGDVALAAIEDTLGELERAAASLSSADLANAVASLRAAGTTIGSDVLRDAIGEITLALSALRTGPLTTADLMQGLKTLPGDLQMKLVAIVNETGTTFTELRAGIEEWYTRQMEAASDWYRKQTRYFLFVAGLVIAVAGNVDAIHATETLYRDTDAREAIVAIAQEVGSVTCPDDPTTPAADPTAPATDGVADPSNVDLDCVRDKVGGAVAFPVGWSDVDQGLGAWFVRALGWLTVAVAVTLGAPFWFDLLRRGLELRRGRTTGGS
jgi:hypothetical protein